jgi:hypothetical protein
MADDFDPDAFIKGMGLSTKQASQPSTFDPDAFMQEHGISMPETLRDRERAMRQQIAAEPKNIPAGFAPGAVSERTMPMAPTTFAERAGQWGDVAYGAATGVPAWIAGGELGDIEAGIRPLLHGAAPGTFSAQTLIPTTGEGGWLGQRSLLPEGYQLPAAANEYQAMGRNLASMVMPNIWPLKAVPRLVGAGEGRFPPGPPGPEELPTAPKLTTPRANSAGQRLSPDLLPPTQLPETAPAGAARVSTLEGIDPEAIREVAKDLKASGFSEHTLADTLEQMSPHQFALEVSDPMWNGAEGVYTNGGQGGMDIRSGFTQRTAELPQRMQDIVNRGLGGPEDLSLLRRTLDIDQSKASNPLYQAFRTVNVTPTPQLEALMPRLQAARAFGAARERAAIQGMPWQQSFDTLGAEGMTQSPTAASWDLVKRSLDDRIRAAYTAGEKGLGNDLRDLKNELVNALDTHPEVGDIYRQARQTFAGPQQIKDAWDLGAQVAAGKIHPDELPFAVPFTENGPLMAAVRQGYRNVLQTQLGRRLGPEASNAVVKQLLAPNNQAGLRWIAGDEATDAMIGDLTHEYAMYNSPRNLVYGSRTAPKQVNAARWQPEPKGIIQQTLAATAEPFKFAQEKALSALDARRAVRAQQVQNDAARIYMMQGPERDATLMWILRHGADYRGRKKGGRVVARKDGGRVNAFVPPLNARKNPRDGQWYIPDKCPGKWLRVVPRA